MTKIKRMALLTVFLLGPLALGAQRARRSAEEKASDVDVSRSATFRVTIAGSPAAIFDYLADPGKIEAWLADQSVLEPQLGGRYHFRWNGKPGVWSGRVTYFIRGNTLGYTWEAPGEEYETNVLIKLTPQGSQTVVELTHSGFTSDAAMDKAIRFWNFYLQNLKSVIEEGVDLREQPRRPARRSRRG